MATIGNAPVFPTESVLPGNLQVTGNATVSGNATISGSSATVNGNEVRTVGTSGAILQVVQATTSTAVTVNTTTYTDTNLTAAITPTSSSNKILIMINQAYVYLRSALDMGMGVRIVRDSTTIWTSVESGTGPFYDYIDNSTEHDGYATIVYLDSPATTSSTTYKTQGRPWNTSNTGRVIFNPSNTVANSVSTITLMEVVA